MIIRILYIYVLLQVTLHPKIIKSFRIQINMEYKKGLILILIIANIFLSSYLVYQDITKIDGFCLTGQGCKIVQTSEYSSLFGIKLAYLGLSFFILSLVIYLLTLNNKIKKKYFLAISSISALFALYFLFLQFFIIKALCSTCLAIDIFAIIIFITSLLNLKK